MKNNQKAAYFPIPVLRESLRQNACACAEKISRSVGRLTSCDELPCLEYGDEVQVQRNLAERLFYAQNCRTALERCIDCGAVTLRYRWADGAVTRTTFRKIGPNRVKVTGMRETAAA